MLAARSFSKWNIAIYCTRHGQSGFANKVSNLAFDAFGGVSAPGGWLTATLSFRYRSVIVLVCMSKTHFAVAAAACGGASDHAAGNGVSSSGAGR